MGPEAASRSITPSHSTPIRRLLIRVAVAGSIILPIAIAVDVSPAIAASNPSINSFFPNLSTLSSSGGQDTMKWTVSNAVKCSMQGPTSIFPTGEETGLACSNSGTNTLGIGDFPSNDTSSPETYTFTLLVDGAAGTTEASMPASVTVEPPPPPTGSLQLAVSGFPATCGVQADITGPNGFNQVLSGLTPGSSQTISGLAAGSGYDVLPGTTDCNAVFFYPSQGDYPETVTSGSMTSLTIPYLATPQGSLSVQVLDSPVNLATFSGGVDQIHLSGTSGLANGFGALVDTSSSLSLIPGTWDVSANSFAYNGTIYTPIVSASSISVQSGQLYSLTIQYVPTQASEAIASASPLTQAAAKGTLANQPFGVYVETSSGSPVGSDPVTFQVIPQGSGATGTLGNGTSSYTVNTNSNGYATSPFTSGSMIGNAQISATASGATGSPTFNVSVIGQAALSAGTAVATTAIGDLVGKIAGDAASNILGLPFIGDTLSTATQNSLQALVDNPEQAIAQGGEAIVATVTDGNPVFSYVCKQSSSCELAALKGNQEFLQTYQDTVQSINGQPFVWALSLGGGVVVGMICEAPAIVATGGIGTFACVALGTAVSGAIASWLGGAADASNGNQTLGQMISNLSSGVSQLVSNGESTGQAFWNSLTNAVGTVAQNSAPAIDASINSVLSWAQQAVSSGSDVITNFGDVTAMTSSQNLTASFSGGTSQVWVTSLGSPFSVPATGILANPSYGAVALNKDSTATSGSITQCGLPTGSTLAYFTGTSWQKFSSQSASGSCVTASVGGGTTPTIQSMIGATTWIAGGVSVTPTAVTVTASSSPGTVGTSEQLTIGVSPVPDGGTVTVSFDGSPLPGCTALVLSGSGKATCTDPSPPAGSHFVDATYTGDAQYGTGHGQLKLVINRIQTATSIKLSATSIPFGSEQKEVFTATVRQAKGSRIPSGTVKIYTGKKLVCTVSKLVNGKGSCSPGSKAMTRGTHAITASYTGNSTFRPSTSSSATVKVT